jgi:lipid-A-disaccharide synthase
MARVVDHVRALLPFEPPYMESAGMTCDFVGHPVAAQPQATPSEVAALRREFGIGDTQRLMVLLPGSRRGEITRIGPAFAEVTQRLRAQNPDLAVLLPAAGAVADDLPSLFPPDSAGWPRILDPRGRTASEAEARKRAAFAAADAALAASGTVSLELAAAGTPMVIAYKSGPVTEWIVQRMALVDSATLVNLVTDTRAVPEFFFRNFAPDRIAAAVGNLLGDPAAAAAQRATGQRAMELLGRDGEAPGLRAAGSVLTAIGKQTRRSGEEKRA